MAINAQYAHTGTLARYVRRGGEGLYGRMAIPTQDGGQLSCDPYPLTLRGACDPSQCVNALAGPSGASFPCPVLSCQHGQRENCCRLAGAAA